ncbi:class I SAM-dependent methyltransferase [Mycolicibacterium sp.]|uniref:class I SAM-dependent methyltransferase n=1 Tax=Mycolicibacterium sp. TaxID=2320850 RepID=UPI003D0E6BF5
MDNDGPSRTALITAYARAYHQIADQPTIFPDPLAVPLLGTAAAELAELSARTDDQIGAVLNDRTRRLFFAARSRFAEDTIAASVAAGTRQAVILGAGLDTFAYRNANPDLRVFEVDHPATQQWKRRRLAAAGIDIPSTATLVPVDFETQDLATELESTAFTRTEPAIFVWLGVVFYLTPNSVHTTLGYIAGQGGPVSVVLDYLQSATSDEDRAHQQARADRLATIGEPLISYFTPDELSRDLHTFGFTDIDDRSGRALVSAYLGESVDTGEESARVLRSSRVLRATRR